METPEVPSQPEEIGTSINTALGLESAPPETPAVPVEEAPFDPATYTIPDRIIEGAPKSFEKFRNKALTDFAISYENVEKSFHQKAQEAAQARKEAEDLRIRLAAAEQLARITQQPQVPQQPVDKWQGANPAEHVITDPQRVFDRTLSVAEQRAQEIAQKAATEAEQRIEAKLQREREEQAVFQTFETAKSELRAAGYDISDEQWREDLKFIAPVAAREGQLFNTKWYVESFSRLKGPIKASLPKEGNPPVAARTSTAPTAVPSINREDRAIRERFADALGFTGEERKNYIERGGQA